MAESNTSQTTELVIGTRKSKVMNVVLSSFVAVPPKKVLTSCDFQLAMWQAQFVLDSLQKLMPELQCRIDGMTSEGDRNLDIALSRFATKGIFTKELDRALLTNRIDIAVHSLKDLPTTLPAGLRMAAVLQRGRVEDAVVMSSSHQITSLTDLPDVSRAVCGVVVCSNAAVLQGSVIGTSSLRRRALLARQHPKLKCSVIRGNVNTRISRCDKGEYDAVILAAVGLERVGLGDRISQILKADTFPYAVGQGALAVVCRSDDERTFTLMRSLHDTNTALMCAAERSLLRTLEGGCKVPIGVHSSFDEENANVLTLYACVAELDGVVFVEKSLSGVVMSEEAADELGAAVAKCILQNGGGEILAAIRSEAEQQVQIQ